MKKNNETKKVVNKKNSYKSQHKLKNAAKFVIIGIILFAMIFTSFSYLIYALQSV